LAENPLIPQLFQDSAYPELDEDLSNLLVPYIGQGDVAVLVAIKVRDMIDHDMHALYLFSDGGRKVRGTWLKVAHHSQERMIEMGRIFAHFYADKLVRLERLEHRYMARLT
jgi:hypothetical protein